jgi:hypothetical protein
MRREGHEVNVMPGIQKPQRRMYGMQGIAGAACISRALAICGEQALSPARLVCHAPSFNRRPAKHGA